MTTVEKLQAFANKHKVILEQEGEVGFGRPCVGFIRGTGYVNINPYSEGGDYAAIFEEQDLAAPACVDYYHKHDCLCVLVGDNDYAAALEELLIWVEHLESKGELEVVTYSTGATGLQATFSGRIGYAIRFKE